MNDESFRDEDYASMYCEDNGRPSVPPSLMSGIVLLRFHGDVSEQEAVDRLCFGLRRKAAFSLLLDFQPPHQSSLGVFRGRLLEHRQERYADNRLIQVGRTAGFLPDKVTLLIDTTPQRGGRGAGHLDADPEKGIRRVRN